MATIAELVGDESLAAKSYERVKADVAALQADQLVQLNVDLQTIARAVLGALPEMRALRATIVAEPRSSLATPVSRPCPPLKCTEPKQTSLQFEHFMRRHALRVFERLPQAVAKLKASLSPSVRRLCQEEGS